MNEITRHHQDFQELPNITFRQLEVFRVVCREASYANAALELRSTRANIKRVCDDFEKAVGRPLFEEGQNRSVQPTWFAQGLLGQISPLSNSLRRLGDTVKSLHEKGRILRFGAAGEFFKGGLFSDFLGRLHIGDTFRPCFLRIETKRFRTALLSAECDVYFGVGISASDRLDQVRLGTIPWKTRTGNGRPIRQPAKPADLPAEKWWIADAGEADVATKILSAFHAGGASGGRILTADGAAADDIVFDLDTVARPLTAADALWPSFEFSAVLKKNHPYTELLPRLAGATLS